MSICDEKLQIQNGGYLCFLAGLKPLAFGVDDFWAISVIWLATLP